MRAGCAIFPGLIFLKYVSDSFEARAEEIKYELIADGFEGETLDSALETLLDSPTEFYRAGVYFVPEKARWNYIAGFAKTDRIGAVIDAAMRVIMEQNDRLRGALSEIYNKENVDQRRLAGLVDLFSNADFRGIREQTGRSSQDVLGEVYEYCLGKFAAKQGQRGGEFYTPRIWMVDPDTDWLNFTSTEFVVLEPRPGVDVGSLWAVYRAPRVSWMLSEYARGTSSSHQRVSPKDILSACVVHVRVPEAHTKLIRDLIAENVTLSKTRDLLIRKLIK